MMFGLLLFQRISGCILGMLTVAALSAGEVWQYQANPSTPAPRGSLTEVSGSDLSGTPVYRLEGDFSKGGSEVAMVRNFAPARSLAEVRFKIKSSAPGMAIRFTDETGQTHQHFFRLTTNPALWQELEIPVTGSASSHWGGPNDGRLRGSISKLELILPDRLLDRERKETLQVTDFQMVPYLAQTSEVQIPLTAHCWHYDSDTWKFKDGKISWKGELQRNGSSDAIIYFLEQPIDFQTLKLTVKGIDGKINIDCYDATSQAHSIPVEVHALDREQTVTIPVTGSPNHWGGANDGVLVPPIKCFGIVVTYDSLKDHRADLEISKIAVTTRDPNADLLRWSVPSPENLFRTPDDQSPVSIHTSTEQMEIPGATHYEYYDYHGQKCASGKALYNAKSELLQAPPPPSRGFYELRYPTLKITVGVAVDDPAAPNPDSFCAVDGSFSSYYPPADEAGMRSFMRIMKKNGFGWNRDRLNWPYLEPSKGEFQFENRIGRYHRIAAEEGIRTMDVFSDAPAWMGADKPSQQYGNRSNPYPRDLLAAGNGLTRITQEWQGTLKALEMWNEPDYHFGSYFPAAYVVALTKATSRSFADQNLDSMVVGNAVSNIRPGTEYLETFFRNGLLKDLDVLTYHSYAGATGLENNVRAIREAARKSDPENEAIPLWISECSRPWVRIGVRPLPVEELNAAADFVCTTVESFALGNRRQFMLSAKPYYEDNLGFGMCDSKYAPLRIIAAYGHLSRVLKDREYVGDLRDTNALCSRVLAGKDDLVAVLYAGLERNRVDAFTLPKGLPIEKVTAPDGSPLVVENGRISGYDGLVYVYLPLDAAKKFVNSNTEAMKLYRLAKSWKPRPRAAKPLVLQPMPDLNQFFIDRFGFILKDNASTEFKVKVFNFGKTPLRFDPELKLPEGVTVLTPPAAVTVPAKGSADIAFRIACDDSVLPDRFRSLYVSDRGGNATNLCFVFQPNQLNVKLPVWPLAQMEKDKSLARLLAAKNWIKVDSGIFWMPYAPSAVVANVDVQFRVFYDSWRLIWQVLVRDKSHFNTYVPSEAWRGDSVQLTVQPRTPQTAPFWTELTAAHCPEGNTVYRHSPPYEISKHCRLVFQRFEREGYSYYEIQVDAPEMGVKTAPGIEIGSSLLVNSHDGASRTGSIWFGRGIDDGKYCDLFRVYKLMP